MKRREVLGVLGGALVAWPLVTSAQQARVYTLGVLTLPNPEPLLKALREGLRGASYVKGRLLILNLKTTKALGITVPPALIARADEVIE